MNVQECRSCGAKVTWCVNEATGKRAPINAEPSAGGNIAILPDGRYKVYSLAKKLDPNMPRTPLHTNHFMTCPQAKQWAAKH